MKNNFYRYNLNIIPLMHYNKIVLYIEFLKYFNNILLKKNYYNKNYNFYYNSKNCKSLGFSKNFNFKLYDYFNIYNDLLNNFNNINKSKIVSYNFYFNINKNLSKSNIKLYFDF